MGLHVIGQIKDFLQSSHVPFAGGVVVDCGLDLLGFTKQMAGQRRARLGVEKLFRAFFDGVQRNVIPLTKSHMLVH